MLKRSFGTPIEVQARQDANADNQLLQASLRAPRAKK